MVQALHSFDLVLESHEGQRALFAELDRGNPAGRPVNAQVDPAHAPFADESADFVWATVHQFDATPACA
jgi:hypothetical protein